MARTTYEPTIPTSLRITEATELNVIGTTGGADDTGLLFEKGDGWMIAYPRLDVVVELL
jgi:hypothetical protein